MPVTVDGMPWREARPFGAGGPTNEQLNTECLVPISRELGYCLCFHPFQEMIDFKGFGCRFCGTTVTEDSHGSEAKRLRTAAILRTYPKLARKAAPDGD